MMKELNKIEFEKALTGIESPFMIKYFLKEYIAFETEDGKLLTIRKNPEIDKTIYYDDELEPPVVNFETFKRYNAVIVKYFNCFYCIGFAKMKIVYCIIV